MQANTWCPSSGYYVWKQWPVSNMRAAESHAHYVMRPHHVRGEWFAQEGTDPALEETMMTIVSDVEATLCQA